MAYSGRDWVYGFAPGSVFKTAIADDQPFAQFSCDNFVVNPDNKLRIPNRASGQRFRDILDVGMDQKGSTPMFNLSTEVLKTEIDHMLYLVMQYVTEEVATPFAKTFTLPATTNVPIFSSDAGHFVTFIAKSPIASQSVKISSMVGNSLELSIQDGFLFANLGLIGLGFTRTANPSGTWTKSPQDKFHINDITTCEIGGNVVILKDFSLSITPTVIPHNPGSGTWGNFTIVNWEVKTKLVVEYDANALTAQAAMDTGTETTIQVEWGTTDADGNLDFIIRGIMEEAPEVKEDVAAISFSLIGASDIAGSQELITAVVANAVDRAW